MMIFFLLFVLLPTSYSLDACAFKCIWQSSSSFIPDSVPNCICNPYTLCNAPTDCIYHPYTTCNINHLCSPSSNQLDMLLEQTNRSILLEAVLTNILSSNATKCPTKAGFASAPGCPCDDKVLYCPNGTYCGSNNICLKCPKGSLCVYPKNNPRLCPFGYFCPNATSQVFCPQGHFCPQGSYEPIQCTPGLQYMDLPTPPLSLAQKFSTQPLYGTFCPANVTGAPFPTCPGGFYCPTPNESYPCPSGSYCKPQSLQPRKCPILTRCPAQTAYPSFSYIIVVFVVLLMSPLCIHCWLLFSVKLFVKPCVKTPNTPDISYKVHNNQLSYPNILLGSDSDTSKALVFNHVTVIDPKTSNTWLQPTSGHFTYNGLNAVMGGSGCGKSTLMEVLRGRMYSGQVSGTAYIPQKDECIDFSSPSHLTRYRQNFAFVPQDDVLYGNLTVEENVMLSALLKCKSKQTPDYIRSLLESMGLDSTLHNKLVGTVANRGISGGQRKRVSIAMEIVTRKPIIVLDEPTSGLDSTGSYLVLKVLRDIPDTTVITILHQPRFNSFMLFDHIILLSKSGSIFMGTPYQSILYFQYALKSNLDPDDNPADAIMDIVTKQHKTLAPHWDEKGFLWMTDAKQAFPSMETMSPSITSQTLAVLSQVAMDPKSILKLFHEHSVTHFSLEDANYIASTIQDISKYVQTITHPNTIVAQVDLFRYTNLNPIALPVDHSPHLSLEVYPIVRRFCNIMLKRYVKTRPGLQHRMQTQRIKQKFNMLLMVMNSGQSGQSVQSRQSIIAHTESSQGLPNKFMQFLVVLWTCLKSQYRSLFMIQAIVTLCAGFIIGGIQGSAWNCLEYPSKISMATTCLTILSTIKHVDTFTVDSLIVRRNIYNNASITSYTIALMTVDVLWILIMPLLFLVPYYYLVFPTTPFGVIYGFMILACMWASGLAYMITQIPYLNNIPVWCNLLSVFIVIILGVFFNGLTSPTLANSNHIVRALHGISYNRWITEALSIIELSNWEPSQNNSIYSFMQKIGICSRHVKSNNSEQLVLLVVKSISGLTNIKSLCTYAVRNAWGALLGISMAFRVASYIIFQLKYVSNFKRLLGSHT